MRNPFKPKPRSEPREPTPAERIYKMQQIERIMSRAIDREEWDMVQACCLDIQWHSRQLKLDDKLNTEELEDWK